MEKLGKESSGGELDFFKVHHSAMDVNSSSDYSFWFYKSSRGGYPRWKYRQVSKNKVQSFDSHDLILLPKRYKGKRLTKSEIQFLLSVRKAWWGSDSISSYEHIDSLLAMHRSVIGSSRKRMVSTVLFGSALIAGAAWVATSVLSGVVFSVGLAKVFGVSLGFALPAIAAAELTKFIPNRNMLSNIDIEEVFMIADSKYIHADFVEYRKYLKGEWSSLSNQMKEKISAQHPIPSMLKTYRERYRAMSRLDMSIRNLEKRALLGSDGQDTSFRSSWDDLLLVLENVKQEWAEWEMDILRIVQYPALFDMREKATIKFHRALILAESKKPSPDQPYSDSHPFSNAVTDLQLAWTMAKNEAERIQQSHFNKEERVRLSRALDLLNLALNDSGTPAERQASYKRAVKQLEGLVRVPAAAKIAIESGVGLKVLEQGQ